MRAVKSRDTTPERLLRKLLRPIAPGYRLHRKDIPGRPDIAYPGRRIAIFVHGCFWHGHDCVRGARSPKANAEYWSDKISRNRARDTANLTALDEKGWNSLVVWECEMKDPQAVQARLRALVTNPSSTRR